MGKQLRRANKKDKVRQYYQILMWGRPAMNLGFYQEYDKRKHKDLGKYKMDFLKSIIVNDKLYKSDKISKFGKGTVMVLIL